MLIILGTVLMVVVLPATAVLALLLVAEATQRARERRIARQVAVTDAIDAEFGLVLAPVVTRGRGRGWRVEIAMPLDEAAMVGRVVALAQAAMRRAEPRLASLDVVLRTPTPDNADATPAADGRHRRARGGEVIAWTGTSTSRAS
jgi:hypothetical protein